MRARSGAARPSLPLRTPWHWPHPFFTYTSQPAISAQSGADGSGDWDACCSAAADAKRRRSRQHAKAVRRTEDFVAITRAVYCRLTHKTDPWLLDGHSTQPRGYGRPVTPWVFGAADRIRTGDVQLGKLAFCH